MMIDVHNVAVRRIQIVSFQVGIIISNLLYISFDPRGRKDDFKSIKLSDGRTLHVYNKMYNILPGSWEQIHINFYKLEEFHPGNKIDFVLRIFSELGTRDYPFAALCE